MKNLEQVSLPDKVCPDRTARLQPETHNKRRELLAIPYRRKSAIQSFGEGGKEQEAEDARELATVHSKLASVAYISSLNGGFPTIQCGSLDWSTSVKFGRRREMISTERRLSDARPGREARRCEQPGPKNIYSSDEQRETSDEQGATGDERGKRGGGRAISERRTSGDGGDRGERRSDE